MLTDDASAAERFEADDGLAAVCAALPPPLAWVLLACTPVFLDSVDWRLEADCRFSGLAGYRLEAEMSMRCRCYIYNIPECGILIQFSL